MPSQKRPVRGLDLDAILAAVDEKMDVRLGQAKDYARQRIVSARGGLITMYEAADAETLTAANTFSNNTLTIAQAHADQAAANVAALSEPRRNDPQVVVPVSGDTVSATGGRTALLILNPSAALAALTVALPESPLHGDRLRVQTTRTITAATWSAPAGVTISGAPAALNGLGGGIEFCYVNGGSTKTWVRVA